METDPCIPPGFRFHPTEEELVGYYLARKVASQKIDLDVIADIDLYRIEPWDLQDRCKLGYEEQTEWYFFSHKDRKYPSGTRTNRATVAGFWKATGRDKAVFSKRKLIGMRKTLVFYKGRAPNGRKTDWIMHEYRLETGDQGGAPQDEGWVVCRAFQKKNPNQRLNTEPWDRINYLRHHNHDTHPSFIDSVGPKGIMEAYQRVNFHDQAFGHRYEVGVEQTHMDQNLHLPQLSSPGLATSLAIGDGFEANELLKQEGDQNNNYGGKVVDWKELDKLLASQLSETTCSNSNLSVFPLENEEHQLDGFLASFTDS